MSLKEKKELETNKFELTINVDAEAFEEGLKRAFKKEGKKIIIPGFRKGKAPRNFIEKFYGKTIFYDEAVDQSYPKALDEAIKESELDVIPNSAELNLGEVNENGYTFTATLFVYPTIEIENYKGLEIEKKSEAVTDEDIEDEIKVAREKIARWITVEGRPAQDGDVVSIDLEGFLNGELIEDEVAKDYDLTLGIDDFAPGFDAQVVGHSVDESFEVYVTFPDDEELYGDLSGKDITYKVHINKIEEEELPEFDDEFVKDVSEFDTVDEYKKDITEKLAQRKKEEAEKDFDKQVATKLTELIKGDIPDIMIENKMDEDIANLEYRMQQQGFDLDSYIKFIGSTREEMRENFREKAIHVVKLRLALEKIAEIEKLNPTEEEIEKDYDRLAEELKISKNQVKMFIPKDDVAKDLAADRALKLVKDSVNVKVSE